MEHERTGPLVTPNEVVLSMTDGRVSLILNGAEIAGAIEPDWRLTNVVSNDGTRTAKLTVTYPVLLP